MKNTNQTLGDKVANSATLKAIVIGILMLMMLIHIAMIINLIEERERVSKSVTDEISSKWGYEQTITGPIIAVPYKYNMMDNNILKEIQAYAYFLPEELNIEANVTPEIRYRSIYKVVVYQSDIKASGKFSHPDFSKLNRTAISIDWENAFAFVGIFDVRGIRNDIVFNWNGNRKEATPGIGGSNLVNSGVTIKIPFSTVYDKDVSYTFDFNLTLNGTSGLYFIPVGKTTKTSVTSSWLSPSFDGAFLPDQRNMTPEGFTAQWSVYNFNRNFPQAWTDNEYKVSSSEFGVNLLLPVDHYQKSMRSAKYAIMFIALTFMVFFLVEIISRKKIHPLQYLLVSIGLILFYSLLLAFSEQMNFNLSYLLSASAIVTLITAYSHSIFKNIKKTALMGTFLVVLYIFLYTVLQLEDMALMIGSIGLFIALAIVMYVSRKVDWYRQNDEKEDMSVLN
jgi:inner membrane protein